MANVLVVALAKSPKTFEECRIYLWNLFNKDRNKVLQLEDASVDVCIPYYINYLESKNIIFQEAINYFAFVYPDYTYWSLVKVTLIDTFAKLEKNDLTFTPF